MAWPGLAAAAAAVRWLPHQPRYFTLQHRAQAVSALGWRDISLDPLNWDRQLLTFRDINHLEFLSLV